MADAYDRARPSYPVEAAEWLVGRDPARIVELGAGTGKLTEILVAAGHQVLATDPLPEMLARLAGRVPGARTAVATAHQIPVATHSVDVVVCAQSFHWFADSVALDEIARVLRPGGVLALVWNIRDEGIPWVRKFGAIIGGHRDAGGTDDLAGAVRESALFGGTDEHEFRNWSSLRREDLFDLVRSRSYVAVLTEHERTDLLARVGALYDDYGRGPDGMKLPYLTRCYRALVSDQVPAASPVPEHVLPTGDPDATEAISRAALVDAAPPRDPGTVLIDFK